MDRSSGCHLDPVSPHKLKVESSEEHRESQTSLERSELVSDALSGAGSKGQVPKVLCDLIGVAISRCKALKWQKLFGLVPVSWRSAETNDVRDCYELLLPLSFLIPLFLSLSLPLVLSSQSVSQSVGDYLWIFHTLIKISLPLAILKFPSMSSSMARRKRTGG